MGTTVNKARIIDADFLSLYLFSDKDGSPLADRCSGLYAV